jgi:hypothetical protein
MLGVADTSPINYLVLIEQTAVLPTLYARVLLPPTVVRELHDAEAPEAVRAWAAHLPTWCEVRPPTSLVGAETLAHLGGRGAGGDCLRAG